MKKTLTLLLCLVLSITASAQNYWSKVPSGTSKKLLSISFPSSTVGYISGEDSLLLKTTNGGKTWTPVSFTGLTFPISGKDIVNIRFVSPNVGYAVVSDAINHVYQGSVFKTVNGGTTWSPVQQGNLAPHGTYFFNEGNGYHIGSAFFAGHAIEKVKGDSIADYHTFNLDPSRFLYGIDFLDTTTGIVGGTHGLVYRTFNGGKTWDTVQTNSDSTINAIRYVNRSRIVAVNNDKYGTVIYSLDSGRTWQRDNNSVTFAYPQMKSVVRSKRDSLISVGYGSSFTPGIIYWYKSGSPAYETTTQYLNEVAMRDDSVAYAVGDSGLIITNEMSLLSVNTPFCGVAGISLFPNPSGGLFYIRSDQELQVSVFNAAGSLVYKRHAAAQNQTIDLRNQPRGAYVVEMLTKAGEKVGRSIVLE
jgi:photosystem II stability/assembly factor-like uncharacterized protein